MSVYEKALKDKAKIHLKTAGINIIGGRRDVDSLTNEVEENEKILCIATGKVVQISNDRSRGIGFQRGGRQATGTDSKGALVVTDHKIIIVDKRIFGKQVTIIEGDQISSVQTSSGIISSKVIIQSFGTQYDVTDLKKQAALDFVEAVNKLRKMAKKSNAGGTTVNEVSKMDEIKKAKSLFDEGVISKEEFEKIKEKYL